MQKKKNFALAIVAILAIVCCLTACGKKDSTTSETTTETTTATVTTETKAEEPVVEGTTEQPVEEPATEEPATEPATEPVVEEPVVEAEEPVTEVTTEQPVEPVVEEKAEEPVVEASTEVASEVAEEVVATEEITYVPVEKKYTLYSYELTVVADKGKATITYPASVISEEDINNAALAAFNAYSSIYDLSDVYYSVEDGILTITYPESWGVEEFAIAEKTVADVLPSYVDSVVSYYLAKAEEEKIEEPVLTVGPAVELEAEATAEAEEAVETSAEEVVYVPVEKKYTLYGYELSVVADKGKATITYPASVISEEDINNAALAAFNAYSSIYDLSNVYYSVEDGVLTITYPESWGVEEFAIAEKTVADVLPSYVDSVVSYYLAKAEEEKIEEPVAEVSTEVAIEVSSEVAEEVEATEEVTYVPVEKKYTLYGYEISVVADKGKATITYPASVITEDDIDNAVLAAFVAYSSVYDLDGIGYEVNDGVLTVYYPESWGVEEFAVAEKAIAEALPSYVDSVVSYYAAQAEEAEVEEPAIEEQVVETVAEVVQPAEEASTAEPEAEITVDETVAKADEPVTEQEVEIAVEPETKIASKKSSLTVEVIPGWNLGGEGGKVRAKGFNWAFGVSYEYNISEQFSVGAKVAFNFMFRYAQANVVAKYAFADLGTSSVYAVASAGLDYSFRAQKAGFIGSLGAGYEYNITDSISAFAELSGQFSTIRQFDVTANIGVKLTF